jgi:hypothetical protein
MIGDYDVEIRPFIEPEDVPGEFTPELISRLE